MLCVDLGCIGLCSLGPQELSWAVASICQAYPLGLEGLNRRKSRTERLYGMAATLWVQLWGSCVALPLLWLNFKFPAVLCCGPAVAKLTFLSILNRASPDTIWPGGRLLLKCFWDAPLLLISYAADTVFSSVLPWPFFFNGKNGELVSDIDAQLCMGGRPLARHVPILLEHEVHSVVNMTEEWHGPVEVYKQHGIEQLQLPTLDTTPPSLEHLRDGVAFVRARLKATGGRGRIYIHCKGGRGRMAAACLMANQGMDLESALRMLKATFLRFSQVTEVLEDIHHFLGEEAQFQRDKSLADELNQRFQNGIIVKLLATRPGGIHKTGFDKKVSQVLGLRHGQQPEHEGYLSLGWNLDEWPRCKNHSSGHGIAGNWFTSASFVNEELASPYRPGATDNELREAGISLYGCNRYACGRTPESHKILAVFQPNPIVGCAFIEDAGTNQAGEFTGCAEDWRGSAGLEVSRIFEEAMVLGAWTASFFPRSSTLVAASTQMRRA
ncbi:PTPMT1 [Symbiodinium necroappetens]|uniref:PTPMT1 protein n=1 Tax=Symbiodinium necroappetens TaxID=1628268 RepID=A0A812WH01_9DINO|nr:PTPMT1 [Symbiodinium necroappetens]